MTAPASSETLSDRIGSGHGAARVAVVVHWTDAGSTLACVDSLLLDDQELHVIVVDNASIDGSGAALTSALGSKARVEVLRSDRNGGFGSGCNQGFRRALEGVPQVQQVLLVNPDAIVEPGCIAALCDTLSRRHAGIVGGRVLDTDGRRILFENGRYRPWTLGRSHVAAPPGAAEFRAGFVTGALMAIDADLLRDGLRFDENYFLYVEDLDLCRQVVARGRELWINPAAVIRHQEGGSQRDDPLVLPGMRRRQLEQIARGKVYFARKWLPLPQQVVFLATALALRPIAGACLARNLRFLGPWFRGVREGFRIPLPKR